jgi:mannosyltransferase
MPISGSQIGSVQDRRTLIALAVILLLGSALRLYGLDHESLWYDELLSWRRSSYDTLSQVINEGVRGGVHPPGYLCFLHFVQKGWGDSEWILRFPSALCGVLSIPVIYLLGTSLYTKREGLIAAALMAVLWCPVYYSQEARPYSMLLLATMLAAYFWLRIVRRARDGGSLSYFEVAGYAVTAIVSSYLHYFGLYLIVLQGAAALVLCFRRRRGMLHLAVIYVVIGAAYVPWMPALLEDLRRRPIWIQEPTPGAVLEYLRFLFNGSWSLSIVAALCCCALGWGVYQAFKGQRYRELSFDPLSPTLVLSCWLVLPFAGAYVKSFMSSPVLTPRNLIISLPAAYLLVSRSITRLPAPALGRGLLTSALVAGFILQLVFGMAYYSEPHKEQFREAVQYLVEGESLYADSAILVWGAYRQQFDYCFRKSGSSRQIDLAAGRGDDLVPVVQYLIKENPRYIWYVFVHARAQVEPQFATFLNRNFTILDHRQFVGLSVWLLENPAVREGP